MDLSSIAALIPRLLEGAIVTLQVTALAALLGLVMAFLAGLGRLSLRPFVRRVSSTYIEVFRGTSALVQLFWFVFALPLVGIALGPPWNEWLSLGLVTAAVIALGLNIGAYGAEVVRGAVQAVPKGQTEAAIALNMTRTHRMRRVILPQALIAMLPPFGNLSIELLKATAIVSIIGMSDLMFEAQQVRALTNETTTIFTLVLVIYFVIAYAITLTVRWLERRAARGQTIGRQRPA